MLTTTTRFIVSIITILIFNTIFISVPFASDMSYELFEKCFNKKYDFVCEDRYAFLENMGINIEDDLIDFNDLTLIQEKTTGACKGGIYSHIHDSSQIYYVKQANSYHELIASRLMNLIVGSQAIPTIKLIKNKTRLIASLKLPNFNMDTKADLTNKTILGEVLLIVAMDFIGLIDRHARNMGYVTLDENTLLMARVDLDACFDYESTVTGTHQFPTKTSHLDLKHLFVTMQTYPNDQVEQAVKKITDISDEQIVMITFQAWGILSQTKSSKSLQKCLKLAKKLIERKHAFKKALKKFSKKRIKEPLDMFH